MDKTIDRWTDPDGNGYAFKDTVARAQNRETIDKMNAETADRKSELDIERKRIDNLIKELPATAGEYQQSKLVLHSYGNTAVKCTTTSGNYTNVPAFTTDQGGPLSSLYTKKSNYQIAVNKSGLYLFELRIHVNSLIANKRVELAPFVNDTRNAALASSYNTAGNFTLTQVAALPLWLSANDTVDFRIAPIEAVEVSLQLGDVLVYAIDWEDKFKIPDYTGYAAETKDIRTGADGTVYGTAGEAVRKQIGNLTEDLGNIIINDIVQKASVNILNPETCVEGSYITNTGTYVNQTGYGHSSKIFVKPGQVLRVTYWGNVKSQRGVFFNSLDEKVSSVVSLNDLKDYTDLPYPYFECTVPDGATYVIVNLRYSYINTAVMITLDNDFPQNFVAYVEEIVKKKLSDDVFVPTDNTFTEETKPANSKAVGDAFKNIIKYKPVLYGKNIMFCGDSITFGAQASLDENGIKKNYGYYIQKATGCNAMFNAISGSTMTNISGRNSFSVDRYKNLGDDLDYIILAFGTNDSSQSKDLIGKYGDTTNETFYGAWKIVIDYLIANYPTTKIGIIGFWRGNQSYEWTDALRDISNKYRIPMLDFMFDRNIPIVGGTDFRSYKPDSPFTVDYNTLVARQQTFLADTVHPNDVGYQYISPIIQNYIESL